MQNDWITVFTTDQLYQAGYIKEMLTVNGIEAVIMNQKDSSYHFGSITVLVKQDNKEKAEDLIKAANGE